MGFEIGRKLRSNLSEVPNSLNDCLSAKVATGENLIFSSITNNEVCEFLYRTPTAFLFSDVRTKFKIN